MLGYDAFARFYDLSIERLYTDIRALSADALDLGSARRVLDLPTGTGQSLDTLCSRLAPGGTVVGVDFSEAMLDKARRRVEARGLSAVTLCAGDARTVDLAAVGGPVDRLHIFLGLSVFPDWEAAFENLWGLLAPGGRCVVVDVHADPPGVQGRLVQWTAGADLRRKTWEPLSRCAEDYREVTLPQRWEHGGRIFLATGRRGR